MACWPDQGARGNQECVHVIILELLDVPQCTHGHLMFTCSLHVHLFIKTTQIYSFMLQQSEVQNQFCWNSWSQDVGRVGSFNRCVGVVGGGGINFLARFEASSGHLCVVACVPFLYLWSTSLTFCFHHHITFSFSQISPLEGALCASIEGPPAQSRIIPASQDPHRNHICTVLFYRVTFIGSKN